MLKKLSTLHYLLLILLLGSILRFYGIDFQSIWLDEIHTMNEANPAIPFSQLYGVIMAGEQMPPLYFYVLYFLFHLFGYTVFVARMFSAILGVLSIYALFLAGKEIYSKKAGLIAAFLLSINYFHIFYSQEARPYAFFLVFALFSFYRLAVYLKKPTLNNGIFYGLFAGLMISSHFFGLFALFSQYLIMLLFLLISEKRYQKKFFINAVVSAVITALLFLPSLKIFLNVMEIKDFWIPPPAADSLTLIFREFFGNSELVLALISIFLIFYFIKIANSRSVSFRYLNITENKLTFSFIILFTWIVILLLIPILRSYLSVPMLISRYFIIVLPAVLIIAAIGIQQLRNRIIQLGFLTLFLVFSLTNLLVVKNYYETATKAQFSEAINFIKDSSLGEEKVVSSLGWYLPYFFKDEADRFQVIGIDIDTFIAEMRADTTKISAFWYIEGHGREYMPNEETLEFLKKKFLLAENYDGISVWTKYFIPLSKAPGKPDLSNFNFTEGLHGDAFLYNIESFRTEGNSIEVSGWAFFEGESADKTDIDAIFIKEGTEEILLLPIKNVNRPDVTAYFKSKYNLDRSGFRTTIDKEELEPGEYKLGIYVKKRGSDKEGFLIPGKTLEIQE